MCASICDLARLLGFNPVKTKMLLGQRRLDLLGLERKLQNELDEGPQLPPENGSGKRSRRHNDVNSQQFNKNAGVETPSASSQEGNGNALGFCDTDMTMVQ